MQPSFLKWSQHQPFLGSDQPVLAAFSLWFEYVRILESGTLARIIKNQYVGFIGHLGFEIFQMLSASESFYPRLPLKAKLEKTPHFLMNRPDQIRSLCFPLGIDVRSASQSALPLGSSNCYTLHDSRMAWRKASQLAPMACLERIRGT